MATNFRSLDRFPAARAPATVVPLRRLGRTVANDDRRPPLDDVVAIVGCDGTGKTTIVHDIVARLGRERPTQRRYMGLISGEAGDRIKRLPLIGTRVERHLEAKVRRAQDMEKKVPGAFTAIIMYLFSSWRVLQQRRMMRLARNGTLVIAERYPQAEIPGFHYDGPGLTAGRSDNWLVKKLAAREQRLYDRMAEHRPSLVIRLLIDEDTAHARKSDHPLPELRAKIRDMPRIGYAGATIAEVDARLPYAEVLETVYRLVATAARR